MRAVHVGIVGADATRPCFTPPSPSTWSTTRTFPGYVVARTILGAMLTFAGRASGRRVLCWRRLGCAPERSGCLLSLPSKQQAFCPWPWPRPIAWTGCARLLAEVGQDVRSPPNPVWGSATPRVSPASEPLKASSPIGTATSMPLESSCNKPLTLSYLRREPRAWWTL